MKSAYTTLTTLILSEKISREMEARNCYCFQVDPAANKRSIKQAVEEVFKVHVVKVNTLRRKGKCRRERTPNYGRTALRKRAWVTVKPGEKIEVS